MIDVGMITLASFISPFRRDCYAKAFSINRS